MRRSMWRTLLRILFVSDTGPAPSPPEAMVEPAIPEEWLRLLADVSTGLWRLRRRLIDSGTGQPREEMRRAYRDLQFTWDALLQAGVEILDHTGEPFDAGLSLSVLAYQPTEGIQREQVIETVKPTVYWNKQWIQMGEVIVGMPELAPVPPQETSAEKSLEPPAEAASTQPQDPTQLASTPALPTGASMPDGIDNLKTSEGEPTHAPSHD
jgi:hypothetical protein